MKSALVTGAFRDIGRGIALRLAGKGYGLTITSRKDGDLQVLEQELVAAGAPKVVRHAADMARRDCLPALIAAHEDGFGAMNALVVNAGVGTAGKVADYDLKRLDKTLEVNFACAVVLIKKSLPMLRTAAAEDPVRGARIIGVSSITGAYAEPGLAVYGASKAALLSLLETVNLEESARGVTASAIAPAFVDTDMSDWVTDRIPKDEMIPVEDVVRVVDMLLELSANTVVNRIVLSRKGTNGYSA